MDSPRVIFEFIDSFSCSVKKKLVIDVVCTTLQFLQWFINDKDFASNQTRKIEIVDLIKEFIFYGFIIEILNALGIGFCWLNNTTDIV